MTFDTHSERCLVTISPISGSSFNLSPRISSFQVNGGEKGIEGIALMNGGRVTRFLPQSDFELSFDAFFIGLNTISGDDISVSQYINNPASLDTSKPYKTNPSRNRKKFRVTILWLEDTSVTGNNAELTPNTGMAERLSFVGAYLVNDNISFADLIKQNNFKFKVSPFDVDGAANIQHESTIDSATDRIESLESYTTSNKWYT